MPRWTLEARLTQAERIRALCPWKKSTGPRTLDGKARSALNAWKGGLRSEAARGARLLKEITASTRDLFSSFCQKRISRPISAFSLHFPRFGDFRRVWDLICLPIPSLSTSLEMS